MTRSHETALAQQDMKRRAGKIRRPRRPTLRVVIQRVAGRRKIAVHDTGVQSSLTGLVETAATAPISMIHGFLKVSSKPPGQARLLLDCRQLRPL
jgi:hypothetical protein